MNEQEEKILQKQIQIAKLDVEIRDAENTLERQLEAIEQETEQVISSKRSELAIKKAEYKKLLENI